MKTYNVSHLGKFVAREISYEEACKIQNSCAYGGRSYEYRISECESTQAYIDRTSDGLKGSKLFVSDGIGTADKEDKVSSFDQMVVGGDAIDSASVNLTLTD